MLRFQHIAYLYVLALVPLFIILFVWMIYWRKARIKKMGDERLISTQIIGFIPGRSALKFILLAIGFAIIVIGWANLQMGNKIEKEQRKGVDVAIALDVSKSMLAKDIQPDRLIRAKQLILRLMDKMQNDRISLVVFAGRAYLQVPLTSDYSTVKMILQDVSPATVPTQGTVIGDAIDMAMQSFSQKERKYKSLIIITDGEDHDEHAIEKAREAAETGVVIHTVGIGTPQGATLYDPDTKAVKLDENGNPVVSKLNEDELRSIANAGHGTYSLLNNTDAVAGKLYDNIAGMEQKNFGSVEFKDYTSYFQYFLIIGFILLLVEWLVPGTNKKMKVKTI
ncbi:MAG TPA: VWA domain-containing protein [Flavipsychrobacter sp.]|nr:VWA domain-containing protein [Flavipsychrobacter sp.]